MKKGIKIAGFVTAFAAAAVSLGIVTKAMNKDEVVTSVVPPMSSGLTENVSEDTDYYVQFDLDSEEGSYTRLTAIASNGEERYAHMWYYNSVEDGTYKFDLSKVNSELSSEAFADYEWTIRVEDCFYDGIETKVDNIQIVDNTTDDIYYTDIDGVVAVDGLYKDITMNTAKEATEESVSTTTIYYKGYSNPNIHYKIGNGNWTTVPGVSMVATSEKEGYTHKAVIDLGKSASLTACFNDGNNNWDSKNGSNYSFGIGTYTYSNGKITSIETSGISANILTDTYAPISVNSKIKLLADTVNGMGGYTYKFGYFLNDKETMIANYSDCNYADWSVSKSGTYDLYVDVKDSTGTVVRRMIYGYEVKSVEPLQFWVDKQDSTMIIGETVTTKALFAYEALGENAQYSYSVTRQQDNVTTELSVNDDNSFTWTAPDWGMYEFVATVTDAAGQISSISNTVKVTDENNSLKLMSYGISGDTNGVVIAGNSVYAYVNADGGTEPYTYRFAYIYNDEETVISEDSDTASCSFTPANEGEYTVYYEVTDANGDVAMQMTSFKVESIRIESINISPNKCKVGDTVTLSVTTANEKFYRFANSRVFTLINSVSLKKTILTADITNNYEVEWTPDEAGTYSVDVTVNSYDTEPIRKVVTFDVDEKKYPKNQTVIFYDGFSNPHVHYQIDGSSWTTAPGVAMSVSDEVEGYNFKAVIDLCEATSLTACFNDGENRWDSNNGKNYKFEAGAYGYKNGTITKLDYDLNKLSASINPEGVYTGYFHSSIYYNIAGGTAPYEVTITCDYIDKDEDRKETFTDEGVGMNYYYMAFTHGGEADFTIDVKDAEGRTATSTTRHTIPSIEITEVTSTVNSPQVVGTAITFDTTYKNAYLAKYGYTITENFDITRDGSDDEAVNVFNYGYNTNATWTPTIAGTYTIVASVVDMTGNRDEYTFKYVITDSKEENNTTTIYYTGYSNPNIHYKIGNGNWTSVPGVAMTKTSEKSGYTHKIVIDLEDATALTACFNNGSGSWDSDNGKNYQFGVGTYTYSNGTLTKID